MLETMIVPSKLDHDAWRKLDHLKHQYMFVWTCCQLHLLACLIAFLWSTNASLVCQNTFYSNFPIHDKIWLNDCQHAQVKILRDILDTWWFPMDLQSPGILFTDIHLLASWMVELIFVSDRNPCQIWIDIRRKQLLCFVYRLNLAGEYCRSNFDITLYHSIYTYIF